MERTSLQCGKIYRVLVEGPSKKNPEEFQGRNTHNNMVVFPKCDAQPGQYRYVQTLVHTPATLRGELVEESVALAKGGVA